MNAASWCYTNRFKKANANKYIRICMLCFQRNLVEHVSRDQRALARFSDRAEDWEHRRGGANDKKFARLPYDY